MVAHIISNAAMHTRLPGWVSCRRQTMSAMPAAFAESGHDGWPARQMTLGNMRANGLRSLDVSSWQCHHGTILSADPWPDHVPGSPPFSKPQLGW